MSGWCGGGAIRFARWRETLPTTEGLRRKEAETAARGRARLEELEDEGRTRGTVGSLGRPHQRGQHSRCARSGRVSSQGWRATMRRR